MLAGGCLAALLFWARPWHSGADITDQAFQAALDRAQQTRDDATRPVSERLIGSGDLPPPGTRSVFDQHVGRLGGLPYPFADLLASFDRDDRWQDGTVGLLIPHGRSLTKGQTDFRQPRVLAAARTRIPHPGQNLEPLYAGRLFLGFTEAADEIEVIAYNPQAGRFEFQLVQNYCAGCQPRTVYARRAVCLACHQAGTPIFSVRPWAESNAHIPVARRIAEARGVDWDQASSRDYQGVPLSTQILMPESFDELVAHGAELVLAQRLWLDGCGSTGLACRRQQLAQALFLLMAPAAFHPESTANQELRRHQAEQWPPGGVAVPEHSLRDRDPLVARDWRASWRERLSSLLRELSALPWLGNPAQAPLQRKLADFTRQPPLPPELDPLTLRPPQGQLAPDSLAAAHHLAGLFSANDRKRLLQWSDQQPETVRELVLSGGIDHVLTAGPLRREDVLQALASQLGQAVPASCCPGIAAMPPPQSESASVLPIPARSPLALFQRYCFACHRGNPVQHLNFMGATTQEQLAADIRANPTIRQRLDFDRHQDGEWRSHLMPPPGSEQRRQLDAARHDGADDLQIMRAFLSRSTEP